MKSLIKSLLLIFTLSLIPILAVITDTWNLGLSWHDQQRLYQLTLLCASAGIVYFLTKPSLPRYVILLLFTVLSFGLLSSFFSSFPIWALKEWARYVGLFILVMVIAYSAQKTWFLKAILYLLASATFLNAFQFLVYYLMAFATGILMFNADLLFNGFSNPRFLNQFQPALFTKHQNSAVFC